jgi:hypothetical protein
MRPPVPPGGWNAGPIQCAACGHLWTAVWPAETRDLECSACGAFTPAPELLVDARRVIVDSVN